MSHAITRAQAPRRPWRRVLPWLAAACCLSLLIADLTLGLPGLRRLRGAAKPAVAAPPAQPAPEADSSTTVVLTAAKSLAAGLATEKARVDQLATELGVPGLVEVNADQRIDVRSRAPGIVRQVHVTLGAKVKRGDPLVTLDSPDIGTARLNLRAKQRELLSARIEAAWRAEIAANVELLIPEIVKHTDPGDLETMFADKPLGSFRGLLIQPYTQYDIAMHEEKRSLDLRGKNVIGEHPMILAEHTRQGLQASLFSAIEQAKFDAAQQTRMAHQTLKLAEAAVVDAAQRLRILGVDENVQNLLDHADEVEKTRQEDDITLYQIVAPFDGTIITKSVVPSQQALPTDPLLSLADLSNVWITANVAESDLAKVPSVAGGSIRFITTAYPDREFEAKLLTVGVEVDPLTRTVPIRAQTGNEDGALRPGMFARILFDGPSSEPSLTIPSSAVVWIEGRPGVFRPEGSDPEHPAYVLRPIEPGRQTEGRTVVKSGLKEGDEVVSAGAFALKSELILQNSADDD